MSDVDDSLLMKHRAEVPAITELDQRKVSQKIRPRRYRADIDGLRAVAIVPVVLYHGGIAGFSGGFVGVDVFFVISGFLITSFILTEMDRGGFSLRSFYLRRIRRIFPALFLIVAFCSAIGWFLLTPNDYRRLGESIFAATFFSSNVLFWLELGYFATPIAQHPLLHTWSLGIEEQFYIAYPIFLMLLYRLFPSKLAGTTVVLCVLSFGLNILLLRSDPNAAFFLAPPRIWELLIGALLAMGAIPTPHTRAISELAAASGLGLIALAVFGFSNNTTFPGFAALLPSLGAAAIIWAGTVERGTVTRFLSHPAPVVTGKISYSLYLWHFPLLAFASYLAVEAPSIFVRLSLIVLSVFLAYFSWLYVEQPVRQGRGIFANSRAVFGAAAATLALFGGFGLTLHFDQGLPSHVAEFALAIASSERDFDADRQTCLQTADETGIKYPQLCEFGLADRAPQYALWGDSHAESLRAGFDEEAKKADAAGVFFGRAGCVPQLGFDRTGDTGCHRANDAVVRYLISAPTIRTIILAGRWGLWAEGTPYKRETGKHVDLIDASGAPAANRAALATGLERVIASLTSAGKQVWLVGPIPEIGYDVPRTLYLDAIGIHRHPVDIRPTLEGFDTRQDFVLALFAKLVDKYHVRVVWPHKYLCGVKFCEIQKDGHPLYVDDQHLTRSAALLMAPIFKPIFANAPERSVTEFR